MLPRYRVKPLLDRVKWPKPLQHLPQLPNDYTA
jgi:hypothetical protein